MTDVAPDTVPSPFDGAAERRDALVARIGEAAIGTWDLLAVYLGTKLGLYAGLAAGGPATAPELAARSGLSERHVREWLEHGAVTGLLDVADEPADPTDGAARRYALPAPHAEVLLDADSMAYQAPTAIAVMGALSTLPRIVEAFRTGRGFAMGDAGDDMRVGEAGANRPSYLGPLGRDWLPSIPDIHARLRGQPPARVADVGCGFGWSSIGIALTYPHVHVDGLDLDGPSIDAARRNAASMGVADRVTFAVRDAADPALSGRYDLVTMFETFHDMARPVAVLEAMANLLADGGSIVIMDMKAAERFSAPGDALERNLYGWSLADCLHSGMNHPDARGTGTVMRPSTLVGYASEAGISRVDVLPIDHDAWRFYRLRP